MTTINPVQESEFNYQRFVIQNSRSGWFWIVLAVLMVVPSLAIALIYIVGLLSGLIVPPLRTELLGTWHPNPSLILVTVTVSLNVVVTLVTIGLAHGSIRREKEKHTWSLLRLTTIDSAKIVIGKWWASLWALNGDNVMVIVLRIGLLAMACAVYVPALAEHTSAYRLEFLLLLPFIILQACFDAALSAMMGIASAIPEEEWATVASFTSMTLRLFFSLGVGYWFWLILMGISTDFPGSLILAVQGTLVTLIAFLLGLISAKLLLDYL